MYLLQTWFNLSDEGTEDEISGAEKKHDALIPAVCERESAQMDMGE
ncbi:hypothetical protein AGMMS49546_04880 [Spirochaetia bacterium]|nr:hypothetical protein AGMMS49546_04880 [Spirochaetia bacterium]